MTVTAAEQFAIELLNRMRIDPAATAKSLKVELNQGLPSGGYGTISTTQKQALAGVSILDGSATGHGDWMARTNSFSHIGQGGSSHEDRIRDAGYKFNGAWTVGENLAKAGGATVNEKLIALHLNTLFNSPLHRSNMFNPIYREAGVAETHNNSASFLTQNFGYQSGSIYVTGVAYHDDNKNDFYSMGEGDGGLKFAVLGKSIVKTGQAGGYSLEMKPADSATVKIGSVGQVTVTFGFGAESDSQIRMNVKLDLVNGTDLVSDSSLKLDKGFANASLLGSLNRDLTGNALHNTLEGNSGKNTLTGGLGNDTLSGFAGNDKLLGGAGNDKAYGGLGNDKLFGNAGADTLKGFGGRDFLDGGTGNDRLVGGADADTFKFAKGYGTDKIVDFSIKQGDHLLLNDNLWSGKMTATQVINGFADVTSSGVVFTFEHGETLKLQGIDSLAGLHNVIDIF